MDQIRTLFNDTISFFFWFKIKKQTAVFEAQLPDFSQVSSLLIGSVNLITAYSFLFPYIFEYIQITVSEGETGCECNPIIKSLSV